MLKFEFEFEQYRKVGWACMKTTPLNRWDFYKILGTGIIAFGLIFNPVEFLEKGQKKKRRKGTVPAGPERPQCSRPRREKGPGEPARASDFQI